MSSQFGKQQTCCHRRYTGRQLLCLSGRSQLRSHPHELQPSCWRNTEYWTRREHKNVDLICQAGSLWPRMATVWNCSSPSSIRPFPTARTFYQVFSNSVLTAPWKLGFVLLFEILFTSATSSWYWVQVHWMSCPVLPLALRAALSGNCSTCCQSTCHSSVSI